MRSLNKTTLLIGTLTVILTLMLAANLISTQHIARANCQQIQAINQNIETSISRSKKGLPANAYYREHPEELQKALKQLTQEQKDFQPQSCNALFNPFG